VSVIHSVGLIHSECSALLELRNKRDPAQKAGFFVALFFICCKIDKTGKTGLLDRPGGRIQD
jgi:hypothetical protein